jgi:hypothetical protein
MFFFSRKSFFSVDMDRSHKNNILNDNRIDEYNTNVSREEKLMKRFQRERMVNCC